MRKLIAVAVAAAMAASLVACGSSAETASAAVSESSTASSSGTMDTNTSSEAVVSADAVTPEPENTITYDPDFQAQIIADNDTCTLALQGVGYDDDYGYYWKLSFKNKTSDKTLYAMPSCEELNGMDADFPWIPSVEPGQEETKEVKWDAPGLKIYSINPQDINTVNIHFDVYDEAEWNVDHRVDPVDDDFVIYPKGEENAAPVKREMQPTDYVLVDNEYCTMVICGFDPDGVYGYTAKAYIENKSDEDISLSFGIGSMNGLECRPEGNVGVDAHSNAYTDIYYYDYLDTYKANGKDPASISEIVMPIILEASPSRTIVAEETFTFNPQNNTVASN